MEITDLIPRNQAAELVDKRTVYKFATVEEAVKFGKEQNWQLVG